MLDDSALPVIVDPDGTKVTDLAQLIPELRELFRGAGTVLQCNRTTPSEERYLFTIMLPKPIAAVTRLTPDTVLVTNHLHGSVMGYAQIQVVFAHPPLPGDQTISFIWAPRFLWGNRGPGRDITLDIARKMVRGFAGVLGKAKFVYSQ